MDLRLKRCPLCGQFVPELLYDLHCSVDGMIVARMKRDFPEWSERDGVCGPCLDRYRGRSCPPVKRVRFTAAAVTSVWVPR